ncbi:MAG: LptF/LptG family permease [Bacteroidales bacterium]|nr:LptF/LptG family permease [Bacteroidales bacterium]
MKKLDKFILKSFLGPFIATFLIVIFILMMQFLWVYIDDLAGKGLGLNVILQFLGWGSATMFPLAFPLATLLASIMTMGALGESNELLAMKAAGISLQRIMEPLIYVAILICISAFFAANNLIPVAYNKIYTLRDDIGKTKEEIKIPTGIFYNGIENYSLRIKKRDKKSGMMYDIIVYDHSSQKGNINVTVADSGFVKISPDKSNLMFTLFDGVNYEEDNKMVRRDTSLGLTRIKFSKQYIAIPLENYALHQSKHAKYGNEIMSKNLVQLSKDKDSLRKRYAKSIESHLKTALVNQSLAHSYQLDTSRNKGLTGAFPVDSLYKRSDIDNKMRAYQSALINITNRINNQDFAGREINQTAYPLRRTIIESYRKFTLSLACLIFFFIGAPLGAIIRKGGLGTPAVISMFFFLIYWVVDITGKKLANEGSISPFMGTFASSIVLLPIGIFLTWKSTRDSNLFNAEAYKNFLKKVAASLKLIGKKYGKHEKA